MTGDGVQIASRNIMNASIQLTEGTVQALEDVRTAYQAGTGSFIASGIMEVAKTTLINSFGIDGAAKTTIAAINATPVVLAAVGTTLILGGATYVGMRVVGGKIYRKQQVDKRMNLIEFDIWASYFKEDIVYKKESARGYTFKRDDETISAYIQHLVDDVNTDFAEKLSPEYQARIHDMETLINQNIRPERLQSFHRDMRYYCAYHQIGEFTPKGSWLSLENRNARLALKEQMLNCCKGYNDKATKDKTIEEFEKMKNLVYRFYKVIDIVEADKYKKEKSKFFEEYAIEVEKSISDLVIPEQRELFNSLFRKYRYLGNKCEFDRNNVLYAPFAVEMYSYNLPYWNRGRDASLKDVLKEGLASNEDLAAIACYSLLFSFGAFTTIAAVQNFELTALVKAGNPKAIMFLETNRAINAAATHGICDGICH